MLVKITLSLIAIYLLAVLLTYIFQRNLMYHPNKNKASPEQVNAADMQVITLSTEDQLSITAWYKAANPHLPTLIYFHGNAGSFADRIDRIRSYLNQGFGVLLLSYRGYAGNPGEPSEKGLYQDARAAIKFLLEQQKIPARCIVLFGESLGTGIAVQMATEYSVGAVVLQTPYTSFENLGKFHYRYFPSRWLLKDRYNSLSKIKQVNSPLLVLHGTNDDLVPLSEGKKLFQAANEPKEMKIYPGANHNGIFTQKMAQDVIAFIHADVNCH
ncbi:MAG: alpha/beta fold hydrolase [Proteobacteria bacterium]|nr:alpha/beta fold hydrolase [Pseudomonadota bacterium]